MQNPAHDIFARTQLNDGTKLVQLKSILVSAGSTNVTTETKKGGGCLIATATYGSKLAPQVQQLRELRDNPLLQTSSGTSFMNSFGDFYYSFSPMMADWEREIQYSKKLSK